VGETYLLSIEEDETTENCGSSVSADGLESSEGAKRHARHDHGSETSADEDTETSEKRST
jgi:hypothetical protein